MNPFEIKTSLQSRQSPRVLDWEESAQDVLSSVEAVHDPGRPIKSWHWLRFLLLAVFVVLAGRVFYLQIITGRDFRALSESNRIRSQSILAPRGLIMDRNGQALAQNAASFNLAAIPFDLPKNGPDLEGEIAKAAVIFEFEPHELLDKIKAAGRQSLQPIVAKQGITAEQAILFETRSSEFVGLMVQQIPVRQYINSAAFSHVLGYTGLVSQKDMAFLDPEKYDATDYSGKTGIELAYENYLHGQNGRDMVEVDARGRALDVLGRNEPVAGNKLQLNIDKDLQEKLYNDLKSGRAPKAAAVAMNPKNGEVLALVSLPGFDSNLFARGIRSDDYNQLLEDKNLPLFNRDIAGVYPPGSTVKPMVGLAALEEGIISPSTVINDRGVLVIPNQYDPSINYNFYGWNRGGLGAVNIYSAIAESSDIYFYTVAGGYPNSSITDGLGADKLAGYFRKFNLGKPTGIDLPGEKPGLVADPVWKADYYKTDPILSKWYLGDTYHIGIGQGDMLVTPLQVAEWTAIIANNGVGFKPQILNTVTNKDGKLIFQKSPEILVSKFADEKNLHVIQAAMRQTVTGGSGRQLADLPIEAAGKTGTSQFDGSDPKRTHAWFTAYAPFNDPQIVITVLVEAGGEGHAVAEPVVKNAFLWWAENRYKK